MYLEMKEGLLPEEVLVEKLRSIAEGEDLQQTLRAIDYAGKSHEGQYRSPMGGASERVPYFMHPLQMCMHAWAAGIREDEVLAAMLLHDVCEDCGVAPEDLPFSEGVREVVGLVTKDREMFRRLGKEQASEVYFAGIRGNVRAMLVKCFDRCSNLSTMGMSFSPKKMNAYILETEKYILPLAEMTAAACPELEDVVFLLEYQMRSMVETQKALLQSGSES